MQLPPGYTMDVVLFSDRPQTNPQSLGKSIFFLEKKPQVKDMNNNMNDFWLKPISKIPLKASLSVFNSRYLCQMAEFD